MDAPAEKYIKLMEEAIELFYKNDFQKITNLIEPQLTQARLELRGEERMVLVSLNNTLSGAYAAMNQIEKAYTISLDSMKFAKELMDEEDPDFCGVIRNVARLAQLSGRDEEVEKLFTESIELAEKSGGPFNPEISNVYLIRADVEQELGNLEKSVEYLHKAIDQMLKDEYGDGLAESLQQIVGMLFQSENFELAIEVCERGLDRMKDIYALPYEELREDPTWVMNYPLARVTVLREDYQENGFEPNVMLQLRNHLAQLYSNAQRHGDALGLCRVIHDQIVKVDARPITKPEEQAEGQMLPRELLRADYDIQEEGENVALGHFHINRASFYTHFGSTLHMLGQESEEKDEALLEEATLYYQKAKSFLQEESENPEELGKLIDRNLAEVAKLL